MRKILAFLVLLMLPWTARGQASADWGFYYWIDTEKEAHQLPLGEGRFELDVAALSDGFHAVNMMVVDDRETPSDIKTYLFYKIPASSDVTKFCYSIDGETDSQTEDLGQGHLMLDVSDLKPGLHFLSYCVEDEAGLRSAMETSAFYRMPGESTQRLFYWLAGDEEATEVTNYANGFTVDVSSMKDGFNTLYVQKYDSAPTDIEAHHFVKIPQTEGVGNLSVICIIDGKIVAEDKLPIKGGMIKWDMDVSKIDVGVHKAMFQAITPSGAGSSLAETFFIRTMTESELGTMQCSYTIDGEKHYVERGTQAGHTFHFNLPVEELNEGLHRLDYMLVAETGVTTTQGSSWFIKTPLGGNAVTQYDYWLNDKTDEVQRVTLDTPTDPFQLIKLLPVSSEPLRSSCFHFEAKDGVPMMYAKNDIHFRFHDKSGRWTDENRQYVDYNVACEVTDITPLKEKQTFERPAENDVKWFSFEAEYGDSIAVKSDVATSIQIFDKGGKELYFANGSSSVKFSGCHLFEDGSYYVAIHDATGTGKDLTLDVKRIDKYAIFDYTPNRMSGVGQTYMLLNGNGLEHVKSIELFNDDLCLVADTIVAISSDLVAQFTTTEIVSSPINVSLRVCFNNTETDDCKTIIIENAVSIEPVNYGDIVATVETQRKVGDPYPIKVTLKNNGNVASYGVPLNIAYDNVDGIEELDFVNFGMSLSEKMYESKEFFTITDNLLGKGTEGFFMPMQIPYLGPYEELTFVFGVKTMIPQKKLNFYAWSGKPWYAPRAVDDGAYSRTKVRKAADNDPCDKSNSNTPRPNNRTPDDSDDDGNNPPEDPDDNDPNKPQPYDPDLLYGPGQIADEATDFRIGPGQVLQPWIGAAEAIAGIHIGSTRAREDPYLKEYNNDPNAPYTEDDRFHYRHWGRSPFDIWNDANPFQSQHRSQSKAPNSEPRTAGDYADKDCPDPNPHPTDVWIPGDPNEMTGYVSESGSHYMLPDIEEIFYDIEFENDPEIANSAAHVIIIENHLDDTIYDLSSFTPKDITLSGHKVELDGNPSFVKTIDLRPRINAIGELKGEFDMQTGVAKWTLTSLDPMTMEPTDDIMQGILPVNYDGESGIGNVTYAIKLKQQFPDGTQIKNKASIIFDNNAPIETPIWTNTIDAVAPTGHVVAAKQKDYETATLTVDGTDERSGVWAYDVYVQYGTKAEWLKVAEKVSPREDGTLDVKVYEGINHGFYVCAVDSAGNVEVKEPLCEVRLDLTDVISGDANGDGSVSVGDMTTVISALKGESPEVFDNNGADANHDGVITLDDLQIIIRRILRK